MILKDNKELKQSDFKNERELQKIFEKNIGTILGYKFIQTEFAVGNFRIDTLAFDEETKSFKIIEYKNVKNNSLVDQGYTYLKLMLERKADFVLEYNIKTNSSYKISDIDWSQSRIIFVSPTYTQYQLNASDFKNIPIDLYKVNRYEENIIEIDQIKKTSSVKVQEMEIQGDQKEVDKEVIVYTEDDHLKNASKEVKMLYEKLRSKVLDLDDIDITVLKQTIAFTGSKHIIDVEIQKTGLKIFINMKKGTLNDPFHILEDVSNKGHWGVGNYRVYIHDEDGIDTLMPYIKQSLKVNKK